jgi:mannose/fructose/N-acetylgalactosamine-specific phosphotransferase system component IIC
MMTHRLLVSAVWGGLIALDFIGVGPFMLTQPLVCGPIFGHLLGQTTVGVLVGGIVQLLWLDLSPVGVGIPFDATAATILAIFWATLPAHSALSQITLALLIAVPFGFLFKLADLSSRRLNSVASRLIDRAPDNALLTAVSLGIIGSLFWSWLRYVLLFALSMAAGQWIWMKLAYWPKMTIVDQGLTMAIILLPLAGLGAALELFLSEEPQHRLHSLRDSVRKRRAEDGS